MLILIAGATGILGQKLVAAALSRGHQVRALARNPDKISTDLRSRLESFIVSANYYDVPALERACAGVDAIVCAYNGLPELSVEGQLLLLRAAERAGVKKYVASSWNYDWRTLRLGQQESYDPFICFRRHAELSSSIKPVYMFTGVLGEVLFSTFFTTAYNGIWDRENKQIVTYGTGSEIWQVTTYADAAEYTVEVLQLPNIEEGGFFSTISFELSTYELAKVYGEVRGFEVQVKLKGSVEDLRKIALEARNKGDVKKYYEYIGLFYQLYSLDETWNLRQLDNDRFPGMKPTSLAQFLRENPEL